MNRLNRLFIGLFLLLTALPAVAIDKELVKPDGRWRPEIVDLFATLPVLEGGRIKPLDTTARFTLLRLNGKRTLTVPKPDGNGSFYLEPVEWLLDCFFFPEEARAYRCFSTETNEVVMALDIPPHGKKRDRYSYAELYGGRDKLLELAREYSQTPPEQRGFLEGQIVALAENILFFEDLVAWIDFARLRLQLSADPLFGSTFNNPQGATLSEVLERMPDTLAALQGKAMTDSDNKQAEAGIEHLFQELNRVAGSSRELALFPPEDPKEKAWYSPTQLVEQVLDPQVAVKPSLTLMKRWEAVTAAATPEAFTAAIKQLHADTVRQAESRGEYRRVPLEVTYYRGKFLFYAQWLFVFSFIMVAFSWAAPASRTVRWAGLFSILPPLILLSIGITLRCIIRGRPPVTTLYETILFSTAVMVAISFVIELIQRQRIAATLSALLGVGGLFFAWRYEAREGVDTMPAVVAVLNTNFWLATHVTTIVVGYAAGMLAGALAHIHILGPLIGFRKKDEQFYKGLTRAIYGVTCFCLLFATIGTVLGGVWASKSWGRFWGWDPKENGALLIVLWALIMLHARKGGYMREWGMSIASVALGMIVVFSWWGVNALGVGLHSYGFTSNIWRSLGIFWILESIIMLAGFYQAFRANSSKEPAVS